MTDHVKEMLESSSRDAYTRINSSHPLSIYLGTDNKSRKSIAIIVNAEREKIISTKTITVEYFKRSEDEIMLCFGLEDESLSDLFYKFCDDIIESTQKCTQEESIPTVIKRWNTWIQFFSKTSLPLSEHEILGLIGEIYFLTYVLVEKYGVNLALESYIGVDRAHKDFEIHDIWHEVKAIHNGVRHVKISSLEQLDSNSQGYLEIITFDQSVPNVNHNISLNSIVENFKTLLNNTQRSIFDEKMRKANYVQDDRYDEYNYLFVKRDSYNVYGDFPKISKAVLPVGITKVSYEIDISAIQKYIIKT